MLILKTVLVIDTAHVDEFKALLPDFLAQSRAEAGCHSFAIAEDIEKPAHFVIVEEWVDEDALHQHEASVHVAELKSKIGAWIVDREPAKIYQVEKIKSL